MIDLRVAQAQDEKELSELLISWGVDPDQLTYVHRTAYPVRLGPASVGGPAAGPTDAIRRLAAKD